MRAPRRMLVAGGVVAIALALTGCGDMQPEDLEDLFDQTRDIIDQVEEAVDEQSGDASQGDDSTDDPEPGSEYEERMREAREDWDTYTPPPADIPPIDEYSYATTHGDGTRSATEELTYPGEAADDLTDYYTEQYGAEPAVRDGDPTWSDDLGTTTMRTNADGSVTTESTWYDPAN